MMSHITQGKVYFRVYRSREKDTHLIKKRTLVVEVGCLSQPASRVWAFCQALIRQSDVVQSVLERQLGQ